MKRRNINWFLFVALVLFPCISRASSDIEESLGKALRNTDEAKSLVTLKSFRDAKTGLWMQRKIFQKRIEDTDALSTRVETIPLEQQTLGKSGIVMITNKNGQWMYFAEKNVAIRMDFVQKLQASMQRSAATAEADKFTDNGNTIREESTEDRVSFVITPSSKSKELFTKLVRTAPDWQSSLTSSNVRNIELGSITYVIDKRQHVLLGQLIVDANGKKILDTVCDEVLANQEISDSMFDIPEATTIYVAQAPADLAKYIVVITKLPDKAQP
jgi:outer membrane lipoprotein-sorting protein